VGIYIYQFISLKQSIRHMVHRSGVICFLLSLSLFSNSAIFAQAKFIKKTSWAEQGLWLKADTHIHSSFSDGAHSINEIAANAIKYGFDVIAITDHSDRNLQGASLEYERHISIARRTFPNLIILSGIEWNIPPYDGDQHVSVLISPGPNEFDILREFKKKFDDHQREEHRAELAIQALEWLKKISTQYDSNAVLILNHPSRELSQTDDIQEMFQAWRKENDLIVGLEGAPGHQKVSPNGSYTGLLGTVDGWDPAVVHPGNAWDKLLSNGHDVWGATSSSDFHGTDGDYWPGEFSETWLYAPQRTGEGVLAAIKAGSFFGVQGHIAREGVLTVWASGLERPAYPGEVISVPEGEIVLLNLQSKVPAMDFESKTNFLNELTFIINHRNESTPLTKKQIYLSAANFETSFVVPPDGFTIRGLGKKTRTNQRGFQFLTNPIRIEASSKTADSLLTSRYFEDNWKWLGIFSLVLICVSIFNRIFRRTSKARTKSSSHASETTSHAEPILETSSEFDVDWAPPSKQYEAARVHSVGRHKTVSQGVSDNARKSNFNSSLMVPLIVLFLIWLPTVIAANSPSMHSKLHLSYNVIELLERSPTLVVSLLIAAVACMGFGLSVLTEIWMKQPTIAVAAIPGSFTLIMAIGFVFFSATVPDESLKDVLGAPTIASLSPFLELMLRFIAMVMGPFAGLILGARLAGGKFKKSNLPTFISVTAMLLVSEMFVIHWTETDNITELLDLDAPIVFRFSFVSCFLFGGLVVQQIGTTLARPNIIRTVRTILLLAIGVPICWKLILAIFESEVHKYGYNYSGIQFFLSPSREEILSMDSIFLKFVPLYLLLSVLMAVGVSLGACFTASIQSLMSRDFNNPQGLWESNESPSKSIQLANHFFLFHVFSTSLLS
jgi:histidinol phosphatase-like PHP family hydrolase